MRVIFLIDMNTFFVSCAIAVNPNLKGKPIVVAGSSRHAIVSAVSYEAKKLGIKIPMPLYQAKQIYPAIEIVEPDFKLYVKYSEKIFEFISVNYTKNIEIASIDECYIDVTEIYRNYESIYQLASEMQNRIYQEIGIPSSIGISYNKFLAKIASEMKKPLGITIIRDVKDCENIINPLQIDMMHGVGKQSAIKLKQLNIKYIADLAKIEYFDTLTPIFGKNAFKMVEKAQVKSKDDTLACGSYQPKSISNEITLEYHSQNYDEICLIIKDLAQKVATRACENLLVGNTVSIVIKDAISWKRFLKQTKIGEFTNDFSVIYSKSLILLEKLWTGAKIRLVGISLDNLKDKYDLKQQLTSESYQQLPAVKPTDKLIYNINKTFGKEVVQTGSKYYESSYIRNKAINFKLLRTNLKH